MRRILSLFSTVLILCAIVAGAKHVKASDEKSGAGHPEAVDTDKGIGRIDGPKEDADFEIVKVVVLNRHGHRAPNLPFWTLCPNERGNRDKFHVMPEDLTSVGFEEELHAGQYLKSMYPEFIGAEFNRTLHFFQADGEPRTLQSAMAVAAGAFPTSHKDPSWVLPAHPNLVPVFSSTQNREYWLNDAPCFGQTGVAVSKWLPVGGSAIANENRELLNKVLSLCGTSDAAAKSVSMDQLVKLVVDGLVFEHDFGMSILKNQLSPAEFLAMRNISNAFLFGKLYGTDAQRTFVAAEFPHFLLKSMDFLDTRRTTPVRNLWRDNQKMAWHTPLNVFVVHREMIYGMMFFFDWRYSASGMAPLEVPAGTQFIFEILRQHSTLDLHLRVKMWNPRDGEIPVKVSGCARAHTCSLEELRAIYTTRVTRTGRWDKICGFPKPDAWFPSK